MEGFIDSIHVALVDVLIGKTQRQNKGELERSLKFIDDLGVEIVK